MCRYSLLKSMFYTFVPILFLVSACSNEKEAPKPSADTKAAKIERAMSAGPKQISAKAMVMDVDGSVLREGSNGWMCMPSVMPGDKIPMCNDEVWMALMTAFSRGEPFKAERVGVSYMFGGDIPANNDDPYDTTRDEGEPWVQEGPHIMIVVPDISALEGISDDPNSGGPYVMWKNTPLCTHYDADRSPAISPNPVITVFTAEIAMYCSPKKA
jgi:hypothetical protein